MKLVSPEFANGGVLPRKCLAADLGGEDMPPVLEYSDVPEEAGSLALTCYDPDAPTGSGFWHWIVVNIPAEREGRIEVNTLPSGARVVANDGGQEAFAGALPPPGHGPHRYIFTLHALSCDQIDADMPPAHVRFFIHTNEIDRAKLVARFENPGAGST